MVARLCQWVSPQHENLRTWAWETELIENKPRNLEGGRLTIKTEAKKIKVFTNDEIKVLLAQPANATSSTSC